MSVNNNAMKHTLPHAKGNLAPAQALEKIVVNAGVGRLSHEANFEEKLLLQVKRDLALLAGQEPQVRRATQSVAGFKMREGQIVGLKVTLRGRKMVDFFSRFIMIVLPRVRDFRGIDEKAVDAAGMLNVGIHEHTVFPEINPEQSPKIFSLEVTVVPKARDRAKSLALYRELGVPLKKR